VFTRKLYNRYFRNVSPFLNNQLRPKERGFEKEERVSEIEKKIEKTLDSLGGGYTIKKGFWKN